MLCLHTYLSRSLAICSEQDFEFCPATFWDHIYRALGILLGDENFAESFQLNRWTSGASSFDASKPKSPAVSTTPGADKVTAGNWSSVATCDKWISLRMDHLAQMNKKDRTRSVNKVWLCFDICCVFYCGSCYILYTATPTNIKMNTLRVKKSYFDVYIMLIFDTLQSHV